MQKTKKDCEREKENFVDKAPLVVTLAKSQVKLGLQVVAAIKEGAGQTQRLTIDKKAKKEAYTKQQISDNNERHTLLQKEWTATFSKIMC